MKTISRHVTNKAEQDRAINRLLPVCIAALVVVAGTAITPWIVPSYKDDATWVMIGTSGALIAVLLAGPGIVNLVCDRFKSSNHDAPASTDGK